MIRRFVLLALATVLATVLVPTAAPAQAAPPAGTMFTLTFEEGELFTIDPATAATTPIGLSSVESSTGIVWDPATSQLYAFDWVDEPTLSTIDPDTGASSPVAPMNIPRPTGIDLQPSTGTAFITYDTDGAFGDSTLATLDLATGEATDVGVVTVQDEETGDDVTIRIAGLAFHPTSGVLYGIGYDGHLYEIDPGTAAAELLFTDVDEDAFGLAFDCVDTLYATTLDAELLTIDLSTGVPTVVGSLGLDEDFSENLTVVCDQIEPTTTTTPTTEATPTTSAPVPAALTPAAHPVAAQPRFTG